MKIRRCNGMRGRYLLRLVLLLVLTFSALGVQASGEGQSQATEVSIAAGIGNPPPAGFTVLYMFTGVANETDSGRDESTSINCTNFHPTASVEVRVEIFNQDPAAMYAGNQTLSAGHTGTWSTQSIVAYNDGVILPAVPFIFQGSGRVLVKQHSQIICSAQVLDADVYPPVDAVKLPIYDKYGRRAHALRRTYLPLIRKT